MTREQIAMLVPGGVPDTSGVVKLVVELHELAGESPEVDVDAAVDITTRAARAIFAQAVYIADLEETNAGRRASG